MAMPAASTPEPIKARRDISAPKPLLAVENVNAGYGRVQVLWDVSLTVGEGEIVSLVGANGAGKTTLLRAITGLIRPRSGRVLLEDSPLHGRKVPDIVRRGVSMVPEGRQLFPAMTVEENLELGAAYVPGAWAKRAETLEWVFQLFPRLAERRYQLAGTMSGGEQQMLAVGRAMMARPRVLLIDEPSLGLAPALVMSMFAAFREINKQGVTLLLVEQNVRLSLEMATRGYVLENGRIVLSGSTADLMHNEHVRRAYLGM